jgi:hypothetical protein
MLTLASINAPFFGTPTPLFLPRSSAKEISRQIKQEFKKSAHWVGFYAFGLSRFIPELFMRPLVRMQAKLQSRVGNFSYMGRWGDEKNPTEDIIGGFPPVVRNQPVVGIAVHWGGKLTLNFIMHPFLSRNHHDIKRVVEEWGQNLLADLTS